jgi:hypothetical protein
MSLPDEQEIDTDPFNQKFLKQLYKNILMSFVIDSRVSRRRLSDNEPKSCGTIIRPRVGDISQPKSC